MTPSELLAAFETLAEAPDGVARLRELVLSLAVRGKLVAQDPGEEPASDLMRRLETAKAQAVAEWDLRRPRPLPPIEDDAPHSVPAEWIWCRLGELAYPQAGFAFSSTTFNEVGEGFPLIRIRDVLSGQTQTYYLGDYRDEFIVQADDYLIGMDGNFNINRWRGPNALLNQRVTRLRWFSKSIEPAFIVIALQQRLNALQGSKAYTTVQHLSGKQIEDAPVPLPPLAEQHRIVARIGELMGLLDRLESVRNRRDQVRRAARDAALAALCDAPDAEAVEAAWTRISGEIHALFAHPEDVAPLRQAVLQLAVRGRLVPQDPAEEPAERLLGRIALIKSALIGGFRAYRETVDMSPDNGPAWTLPAGWVWTQVYNIAIVRTGSTPDRSDPSFWGGAVPWVSSGEVANCKIVKTRESITEDALRESSVSLYPIGTVLIAMIGQGKTRGQAAVLQIEAATNQNSAALLLAHGLMVSDYVWRWALAEYSRSRSGGRGNAQPAMNASMVRSLWIPIPPLGEQHRIVAKVDALMAICDAIEARLTTARTLHGQLAAAAVHHLDV